MFKKTLPFLTRQFVMSYNNFEKRQLSQILKYDSNFPKNNIILCCRTGVENLTIRNFAKSKDIKKDKKKKVKIDENELRELFDVGKLFNDMRRPVDGFKEDLLLHATLRSAVGAIENLKVQFEGQTYTIQDLADVGKKNPKLYVLDFSSFPQCIQTVVNTLQNSELNVNVQQEGTKIYVPVPKVTKEHREVLVKKSKMYFTKCKDSIRDVQTKYLKSLRNIEKISEETKFRVIDQLTALGDVHIKMAEDILRTKQTELTESE